MYAPHKCCIFATLASNLCAQSAIQKESGTGASFALGKAKKSACYMKARYENNADAKLARPIAQAIGDDSARHHGAA